MIPGRGSFAIIIDDIFGFWGVIGFLVMFLLVWYFWKLKNQ